MVAHLDGLANHAAFAPIGRNISPTVSGRLLPLQWRFRRPVSFLRTYHQRRLLRMKATRVLSGPTRRLSVVQILLFQKQARRQGVFARAAAAAALGSGGRCRWRQRRQPHVAEHTDVRDRRQSICCKACASCCRSFCRRRCLLRLVPPESSRSS